MSELFATDVTTSKSIINPFREIRRRRGMRATAVAEAMGVELRTYQNLETEFGPASLRYVERFARVTDSDAIALSVAIVLQFPRLAIHSADNKLATWIFSGLEDLERELGDKLSEIESAVVISAVGDAFGKLAAHARRETPILPADTLTAHEMFLTVRQIECLEWVQAGKSSSDIGHILGVSNRTVDEHLAEACKRLQVRTRIQAVAVASELGLIAPSTP